MTAAAAKKKQVTTRKLNLMKQDPTWNVPEQVPLS